MKVIKLKTCQVSISRRLKAPLKHLYDQCTLIYLFSILDLDVIIFPDEC